jgi:hypothetical protein
MRERSIIKETMLNKFGNAKGNVTKFANGLDSLSGLTQYSTMNE